MAWDLLEIGEIGIIIQTTLMTGRTTEVEDEVACGVVVVQGAVEVAEGDEAEGEVVGRLKMLYAMMAKCIRIVVEDHCMLSKSEKEHGLTGA